MYTTVWAKIGVVAIIVAVVVDVIRKNGHAISTGRGGGCCLDVIMHTKFPNEHAIGKEERSSFI